MVSFSKHHHFSGEYFLQTWSIPDSIIYSITKNPSNAKAWQKLIQCCKYFFVKNPILVINDLYLSYEKQKWNIVLSKTENKTPSFYEFQELADFTNVLCKFWLTDVFYMYCFRKPLIPFSAIFSYLHQADVKKFFIYKHNISFNEFLFLTKNVEKFTLRLSVVKSENDEIVPLEKLVKFLPKIKEIWIFDDPIFSSFTENTVKELLEIPQLRTIEKFELYYISEKFDIETFFTYLKKNKHTKFHFRFSDTISEGYKNRLKKIIDEIIATPRHDYTIPFLDFHGIDRSKYKKMCSLFGPLF